MIGWSEDYFRDRIAARPAIITPLGVEVQVPESSTPPIGAEVVARNGIICP